MSDQDLSSKLDAVTSDAAFDDPNFYTKLLGYDQEQTAEVSVEPQPVTPQGETAAPEQTAPAAAPAAAESTPAPASAEPKPEEIAGALTKDGKHVIPYSVVQDLRTTTAQQAQRIAEMQAAMERMQAEQQAQADGKSTAASQAQADAAALQFTEDELADLEAIPAASKLVKGFQAMQQRLTEMSQQPVAPKPAPNVEAVQAVIDSNPLLTKWQAKGGELWAKAVQLDTQLQSDPQWAGKSMAERFAHVQATVADEYGIPVPSASSAPPAAAQQPRPAANGGNTRETLPSLTDFAGGPMAVGGPMAGMSAPQMVDKAVASMSIEDLRKMVGLSY